MGLYLGSDKVSAVITKNTSSDSGIKRVQGTITSDANGVITFPELNFTPSIITVWNITRVENGDGVYDAGYLYEGIMLMAINNNGYWISQGLTNNSGGVYITNASAEGGTGEFFPESSSSGISVNGNVYTYQLARYNNGEVDGLANVEFNYAIYG